MNLAREINNKLDEILLHNEAVADLKKEYEDPTFKLMDEETGEKVTKEIVLNKARTIKDQIIEDLNKLTNNGNNVIDIFTNEYYVNDMTQDKEISEKNQVNKLFDELGKQNNLNN